MKSGAGSSLRSLGRRRRSPFFWELPGEHACRLRELLTAATARPGSSDWYDIPATVRKHRPPDLIRAVLGYGSWYAEGRRTPTSFADIYVVVDDYAAFYGRKLHSWMNRHLPPNVYFLWAPGRDHRRIRGKYNVISSADLERECGPNLRDVYNAGRLTKLLWIAWARDEATRAWLIERLVDANRVLTPVALSLLAEHFDEEDFSLELLGVSYRGEARLEGWERVRALRDDQPGFYREVHGLLLRAFGDATGLLERGPSGYHRCEPVRWAQLQRAAIRLLRRSRWRGYLRWPRIVLTEPQLVDLAASEAERKAGVRVRVTPRIRRHPLLFGLPEFLRVLRERNTQERIHATRRGPRP